MARDRLAAMRGNQPGAGAGAGAGNGYGYGYQEQPSYPQQPQQPPQSYAQQSQVPYDQSPQPPAVGAAGDMNQFFSEINTIQENTRQLNDQISYIKDLHSQLASGVDEQRNAETERQLDSTTQSARQLTTQLKNHIKSLELQNSRLPQSNTELPMRQQQVKTVKNKFMQTIQHYQQVEQESRQKHRQRIERQYRIVKPGASDQEVQQAVDSDQGGQIFSQALMDSSRYGEARAAQREVQQRHAEIKKIENTVVELAKLMDDMATMVEEQNDKVVAIEATAGQVEHDTNAAEMQLRQAVKSARAARRKRWICFFVVLVIIIIIAVVVAVEVTKK